MVRERTFGPARIIDAVNVQNQGDGAQRRFNRALTGEARCRMSGCIA